MEICEGKLKIKLLLVFFCVISYLIYNLYDKKFELKINLLDCMPNGVINSWQEKINPRNFWVTQNVVIESDLSRSWIYDTPQDICSSENNPIEKQKCIFYYESYRRAGIRCKEFTKKMCNLHGGSC